MAALRQNTITVRGEAFTVCEMSSKVMTQVRKLLKDEPHLAPPYIALMCTLDPRQTQPKVEEMPQAVIDAIVTEVSRLGRDEDEPKNV